MTPAVHREAAAHLHSVYEMSERRAYRVLGVDRTSVRYQATRSDDGALRDRFESSGPGAAADRLSPPARDASSRGACGQHEAGPEDLP